VDEDKKRYAAIASIILGFSNIVVGICLPPCGFVLVVVGGVLAVLGVRSEAKLIGWIGLSINIVALLVVIAAQTFNIMLATGYIQMRDVVEELSGRELRPVDAGADADAGAASTSDGGPVDAMPELLDWPEDEESAQTRDEDE
jgi:hypothetical protein